MIPQNRSLSNPPHYFR